MPIPSLRYAPSRGRIPTAVHGLGLGPALAQSPRIPAPNEVFSGAFGEYQERPMTEHLVGRAV